MGVIPSGQENHSGAEHLNIPGRELNVILITVHFWSINTDSNELLEKAYEKSDRGIYN